MFAFLLNGLKGLRAFYVSVVVYFCASVSFAYGQVAELPLSSDYCAILRAFTDKADPRCPIPEALGATRSTGSAATDPFPKGAAPLATAGQDKGYFIRFAFNSVELNAEYRTHLDRLSSVFQSSAMEGVCIKLLGHTDIVGADAYNTRLSLARAKVVEAYLKSRVPDINGRIFSNGLGEKEPLSNIPGGHPLNRRVEILAKAQNAGSCV